MKPSIKGFLPSPSYNKQNIAQVEMEGGKQPADEVRACLSYLQPSAPEENMELALRVVGNIAASGKSPFFIFAT